MCRLGQLGNELFPYLQRTMISFYECLGVCKCIMWTRVSNFIPGFIWTTLVEGIATFTSLVTHRYPFIYSIFISYMKASRWVFHFYCINGTLVKGRRPLCSVDCVIYYVDQVKEALILLLGTLANYLFDLLQLSATRFLWVWPLKSPEEVFIVIIYLFQGILAIKLIL